MEFLPQKFREIVFQLLFSLDGVEEEEVEIIPFLMRELKVSKKLVSLAYQKALSVWKLRSEIDTMISQLAREYALKRIKSVEKNVLRLALYELLFEKESSKKILIAEADRLTRKFGSDEGASFVHAVLDSLETCDSVNQVKI